MTEAEWLACTDPQPMLEFLRGKASERKLRLFAVACCRRIWHLLADERSRTAVEIAEKFAEDLVGEEDRARIHAVLDSETDYSPEGDSFGVAFACATQSVQADAMWAAESTAYAKLARAGSLDHLQAADAELEEGNSQACLLRDIFGPLPFRLAPISPTWKTTTVTSLAQGIYDERGFDRFPVLADALEEVGCDNAAILEHCRQPGEHARGCWVVDVLLGKE